MPTTWAGTVRKGLLVGVHWTPASMQEHRSWLHCRIMLHHLICSRHHSRQRYPLLEREAWAPQPTAQRHRNSLPQPPLQLHLRRSHIRPCIS